MEIIRETGALQKRADAWRAAGRRIALVPTMGALHAGHSALVAAAKARADFTALSLYVNPTQFNSADDFAAYPRDLPKDLAFCRAHGVDAVFAPPPGALELPGAQTWVCVEQLSQPMEGAARAGHFRGVATVVAKLFLAAKPHLAFFGEKDFQQLQVVRRMARDLNFDVEIIGVPTVREADGLALSSRNARLTAEARKQAAVIPRALAAAAAAFAAGEKRRTELLRRAQNEIAKAPLARLEYAELACPKTLQPAPAQLRGPTLLALAVYFGRVRLIDNRLLGDAKGERP